MCLLTCVRGVARRDLTGRAIEAGVRRRKSPISDAQFQRNLSKAMQTIRANIDQYGWHFTGVFPDGESGLQTYFSYTTGLIERGHPEIVVTGLNPNTAHRLVQIAYDEFILNGHVFTDGEESTGLATLPVRFRTCRADHPEYPLSMGRRLYGVETFPALQMVLPDKDGKWPWEDGVDENMKRTQDLLEG